MVDRQSNVIAVIYEGLQDTYHANCEDLLDTKDQGSFSEGPFCSYVPNEDEVEEIKGLIEDGTLGPERNAILILDANADDIPDLIDDTKVDGRQTVGWWYITDQPLDTAWTEFASDEAWETQVDYLLN